MAREAATRAPASGGAAAAGGGGPALPGLAYDTAGRWPLGCSSVWDRVLCQHLILLVQQLEY